MIGGAFWELGFQDDTRSYDDTLHVLRHLRDEPGNADYERSEEASKRCRHRA